MTTRTSAIVVATGAALGILALVLVYSYPIGLGFFIFCALLLGALFVMARVRQITAQRQAMWLMLPILFFAGMLVIRADTTSVVMNLLIGTGLILLMLTFFTAGGLWRQTIFEYPINILRGSVEVLSRPASEIVNTRRWLGEHNGVWKVFVPVLRGLLITIPLVLVFVILLSSADEVFSRLVSDLINRLTPKDLSTAILPLLFTTGFTWLAIGILGFSFAEKAKRSEAAEGDATPRKNTSIPFRLGTTEAVMALGGVCAVFGVFVVIQFVYLFGGEHNIANYSYADYVHRGFMELVAVAVLTLVMVFTLNETTTRHTRLRDNMFRGLSTLLIALTGVILVSAFQRMRLYELTYGFTVLRLQVYIFIIWLGVLFAGFALSLYWKPRAINVFGACALLSVIGFGATLDVVNPDAFVTAQNIQRGDIDPLYLSTLSVEAVPMLTTLIDAPEPGLQQIVREVLKNHQYSLGDLDQDIRGYNLGRANARAALQNIETKLISESSRVNLVSDKLDDFKAFLKPGLTVREVARQFGNPFNYYTTRTYNERTKTLTLYYVTSNPESRSSNERLRLQFDVADGLKEVCIDTSGGVCFFKIP